MTTPVIGVFEGGGIKGIALAGAAAAAMKNGYAFDGLAGTSAGTLVGSLLVVSSGMAARQTLPVLCNNVDRLVEIPVARDPLDFDLTPAEARAMFDHGLETAIQYLDRHPVGV